MEVTVTPKLGLFYSMCICFAYMYVCVCSACTGQKDHLELGLQMTALLCSKVARTAQSPLQHMSKGPHKRRVDLGKEGDT